MELILAGLFALAIFGLVLGIGLYRSAPKQVSAAGLLRDEPTGAVIERGEGTLVRRLLPPAIGLLVEGTDLKALDARLANAGRPYGFTAIELIRFKELAAVLATLLVALLLNESAIFVVILAGLAALVAGYRLPDVWLGSRASGIDRQVDRALPGMIDPLVLALDAGMDLEGALRRVIPRLRGPVRQTFDQVLAELNAGLSLSQAIDRLRARAASEELREMLSVIQQSRRLGVSLSPALRQRSDEMRVRRRLRASEAAQRAPLKMMIPLVLFFLPALMTVFLGPAILSFVGGI